MERARRQALRKSFRTLAEAKAWRINSRAAARASLLRAPSPRTIEEAALAWLEVAITFDRYGHLMPGNQAEAAGLLDAYLLASGLSGTVGVAQQLCDDVVRGLAAGLSHALESAGVLALHADQHAKNGIVIPGMGLCGRAVEQGVEVAGLRVLSCPRIGAHRVWSRRLRSTWVAFHPVTSSQVVGSIFASTMRAQA